MQRPKFCWDANIFIAILTGEERPREELVGLHDVMDLVDASGATVVTSTQLYAEVLYLGNGATLEEVHTALDNVLRRHNYVVTHPSAEIMRRAAEIRRGANEEAGRNIKLPDAVYVATALVHGASELHTFDGRLLALSGHSTVDGLRIVKPSVPQIGLGLGLVELSKHFERS